jgi:hypothetical protein
MISLNHRPCTNSLGKLVGLSAAKMVWRYHQRESVRVIAQSTSPITEAKTDQEDREYKEDKEDMRRAEDAVLTPAEHDAKHNFLTSGHRE